MEGVVTLMGKSLGAWKKGKMAIDAIRKEKWRAMIRAYRWGENEGKEGRFDHQIFPIDLINCLFYNWFCSGRHRCRHWPQRVSLCLWRFSPSCLHHFPHHRLLQVGLWIFDTSQRWVTGFTDLRERERRVSKSEREWEKGDNLRTPSYFTGARVLGSSFLR